MPSVLFINRVYPPAEGATGCLLANLAPKLVQAGWQVTVVTGGEPKAEDGTVPCPLTPDSQPSTPAVPCPLTPDSCVRIERVGGLPFTRASHWKRAISYLSLYPRLVWRTLRLPRHDVIVTLTDPPLHLAFGPLFKWTKRSRLIHWAQDLYPEVAEQLGVLRPGSLSAKVLRWVSTASLRRYDAIIAVGECMKKRLIARGIPAEKVCVIPNWSLPLEEKQKFGKQKAESEGEKLKGSAGQRSDQKSDLSVSAFQHFSFADRPLPPDSRPQPSVTPLSPAPCPLTPDFPPFTVMYSGNFGMAHPFEAIIEAAKIFAGRDQRSEVRDQESDPTVPCPLPPELLPSVLRPPPSLSSNLSSIALAKEEALAKEDDSCPLTPVPCPPSSVLFLFVGDGPRLAELKAATAQLNNVRFLPFQPIEKLAESLRSANIHLASMREDLCGLVVPSKVYGILAAGRPCIFLGPKESETARLLTRHRCGLVLPSDDGQALAETLNRLINRPEELNALQQQAQALAPQLAVDTAAKAFLKILSTED